MRSRASPHGQHGTGADAELVTLADVREARERVTPVLRATAVDRSDTLSRLAGRPVLLKLEHQQRAGSFKLRGAYNRISRLAPGVEVVAGSAGNHAQGVALAASLTGHRSTIFMPASASLPKLDATSAYGATVRLDGDSVDDCIAAAKAFAMECGAVFVPPFDDRLIIAGQGTIALELLEQAPEVETVVVPVGGGGLIAGIAAVLAALRSDVRVIGVEAAGAASMRASAASGQCVQLPRVETMADGIAVKSPSPLTLAHVLAYVEDLVTVTEEEISQAVLLLLERAKAVVEPSALLLIKLIDHGLSAAGRYVALRVILDDRPGSLAMVTAELARLGLNVLSVEHHRSGLDLEVDKVEVRLTLETRNSIHSEEVVGDLQRLGYSVDPIR